MNESNFTIDTSEGAWIVSILVVFFVIIGTTVPFIILDWQSKTKEIGLEPQKQFQEVMNETVIFLIFVALPVGFLSGLICRVILYYLEGV